LWWREGAFGGISGEDRRNLGGLKRTNVDYFDTLKQYVVSPQPIDSVGTFALAVLTLVLPWILLVWLVTLFLRLIVGPFRESQGATLERWRLGARSGARLAWAFGLVTISLLLLTDVVVVLILGRLPDGTAQFPFLFFEVVGCGIAWIIWKSEHAGLKTIQRILRTTKKGAK
jgi:hypothetical protein